MSNLEIRREDFNGHSCQLRMDIYDYSEMLDAAYDVGFVRDDIIGEDKHSMMVLTRVARDDFNYYMPHVITAMDAFMHYFKIRGKIANCQVYDIGEEGYEVRTIVAGLSAVECNEIVPSFKVDFDVSEMSESTQEFCRTFYENEKPEKPIKLQDLEELLDGIENLED